MQFAIESGHGPMSRWKKHVIRENERKQSAMPNGGQNIAYLDSRVQIDTYVVLNRAVYPPTHLGPIVF